MVNGKIFDHDMDSSCKIFIFLWSMLHGFWSSTVSSKQYTIDEFLLVYKYKLSYKLIEKKLNM